MRRRSSLVAIVALAGACSSPSQTESGFISIGRDNRQGAGAAPATGGFAPIGGSDASGGTSIGADGGTGGTVIPQGGNAGDADGGTSGSANGGTSTGAEGGVPDQGGTTGANGGSNGVNGGTGTGGEGNTCGSGGLPTDCERGGEVGRICLPDDRVFYCGERISTIVELCPPGTCATGCCHATSDPCPELSESVYDCAGDCDADSYCSEASLLNLELTPDRIEVVRVGSTTTPHGLNLSNVECDDGPRWYFVLYLTGAVARITVSPPWKLHNGATCPGPSDGQCLVTGRMDLVIVSTPDPLLPSRNIVIETDREGPRCP